MCIQSWGRSSYARALIEIQADVELKHTIVVAMTKLIGGWFPYVSPSTTHFPKKIDKIEKLLIDGKVTLVDDEGKPLEKVDSSGDHDSEDEVTSKETSFVQPSEHVKTPRIFVKPVEHPTQAKNLRKATHESRDCDYYEKQMVQNPIRNHAMRVNHQNSARITHPHSKKHAIPTAVLARVPKEIRYGNLNIQVSHGLGPQKTLSFLFDVQGNPQQALKDKGKFDGKADEGFLVGYSVSSKAFRVFNSRTRIVQERLHINFLKNQPNVAGNGPTWLFDIDTLTQSMNYQLVFAGNQPNSSVGIQENLDADKVSKETVSTQQYVLLPLWFTGLKDPQNTDDDTAFDDKENESEVYVSPSSSDKQKKHNVKAKIEAKGKSLLEFAPVTDVKPNSTNNTNSFNATGPSDNVVSPTFEIDGKSSFVDLLNTLKIQTCLFWKTLFIHTMKKMLGHTQEEGIDYEEVFAPVARNEAIRLFLAYASFMGFMVYQMLVKSDFLYGTIKEEVYVGQPPGFEDPDYLDKVYKVVKAFYGLHQAPKAWYETLANYLLENGFQRGKIDQTLFIKKQKGDILLVQVYVDDIIFGSTNKELCKAFEKLLKDKFQMSSMGELTFFLGLQYVVTISSTETEYVAAISCYAQVLWIQNQVLDYGHFLNAVSSKFMMFGLMIDAAHLMLLVDNLSSYNTKYTSPALTQKVFANMRRIGKGFSRVDTPLFYGMLVQQQVQAVKDAAEDDDDDNEVSAAPTPPSLIPATPPPSPTQEHIP
nr:putative ribonuclease H-like domain-containing protein [Tanacetum cinerariifolium]